MASGVGGGEGGGRAGGGGGGGACCWVAHDVDDVYLHIWTGVPGVLAQLKNHPLGKEVEGGGRRQPGGGGGAGERKMLASLASWGGLMPRNSSPFYVSLRIHSPSSLRHFKDLNLFGNFKISVHSTAN